MSKTAVSRVGARNAPVAAEHSRGAFLSVSDVSKDFLTTSGNTVRSVAVLHRLSLEFQRGEFVSIVGPSGCGKSTLLSIIAGLPPHFPPDQGEVSLDGKPVRGPSAERGMVFQEYAIFPWKTAIENIEYPLIVAGVRRREARERARDYLRVLGLDGFEDSFPHQLSGGMKQRVAVARALVSGPKILLMDEPFAAVDAQTRLLMQEELLRVWEQQRVTVLFVTHSVPEAIFLADRILVMTGRPGEIRTDRRVPLPRPRRWADVDQDERFVSLQHEITNLIMRTVSQGDDHGSSRDSRA